MERRPERETRSRLGESLAGAQGRGHRSLGPMLSISSQGGHVPHWAGLQGMFCWGLWSQVAGSPQDGRFSGVISCSTSRMNRRHSSSCQGRATHCTATGSPTLFFRACRRHGHWEWGTPRVQEGSASLRRRVASGAGCCTDFRKAAEDAEC